MDLSLAVWVFFRLQEMGVTYARRGDELMPQPRITKTMVLEMQPQVTCSRGPGRSWVPGGYQHRRGR